MSHVVAWPYPALVLAALFAAGYYVLRQRSAGPGNPNGVRVGLLTPDRHSQSTTEDA